MKALGRKPLSEGKKNKPLALDRALRSIHRYQDLEWIVAERESNRVVPRNAFRPLWERKVLFFGGGIPMSDLPEYRLEKLRTLQETGTQVWPERFAVTHSLAAAAQLPDDTPNVRIAGRIISIRKLGKLTFAHLQDIHGQVQFALKKNILQDKYDEFHKTVDIGDFVGIIGSTFSTRTGEKTVQTEDYVFLGKALRELPEKWHGLTDIELRYRQRYLDLITNADSRRVFLLRTQLLKAIRNFLDNKGFLEVETPVLTNQASGALAKPFITHHNTLDIDLYLRIAPETYLKRLIVGGFPHVYEVARNFRNEGISPVHLQDFTMIEGYSAYWNYEDNMRLMREMLLYVLEEVFGSYVITIGDMKLTSRRMACRHLPRFDQEGCRSGYQ